MCAIRLSYEAKIMVMDAAMAGKERLASIRRETRSNSNCERSGNCGPVQSR